MKLAVLTPNEKKAYVKEHETLAMVRYNTAFQRNTWSHRR